MMAYIASDFLPGRGIGASETVSRIYESRSAFTSHRNVSSLCMACFAENARARRAALCSTFSLVVVAVNHGRHFWSKSGVCAYRQPLLTKVAAACAPSKHTHTHTHTHTAHATDSRAAL